MTKRNKKSVDFHEFLTLRRDREGRTARVNRLSRSRLDLNHFCQFQKVSQDQDKQSQSRDDHEKSIKIQRQKSSEERGQREKRVKILKNSFSSFESKMLNDLLIKF
jgi:hypothetical protein